MTGPRIGLTDLERAKYYPESTIEESTVRVRPDQPIEVSTVGNVENIENLESVDVIDEVSNVSSVDVVDELSHVTNVDSLDLVSEVAHVTNIDVVDAVTEIITPLRHQDYSVVPHETYTHSLSYFLNAGSADQNVNGSVTPVDFTLTATMRSLIHSIDIVMVIRNLLTVLDYGIVSGGLTNGVQIIRKIGLVETVVFTVRRLIEYAHPSIAGAYTNISLKSNATEDVLIASIVLKDPVVMQTGDSLIIRIRDNLTLATSGIAYQRGSVLLKEV